MLSGWSPQKQGGGIGTCSRKGLSGSWSPCHNAHPPEPAQHPSRQPHGRPGDRSHRERPPPMAGFPIGGGHNPSLPPHKCSRTTAERGQVRRDSLARCTPNKRTHLPRIGGVGTVPTCGPGDGSRWEMERGGSTVPPTVGTNQSTVNPPAPATSNCHSPHFPVVGHSDPCWHASFRIVAALHPNRWRHQW